MVWKMKGTILGYLGELVARELKVFETSMNRCQDDFKKLTSCMNGCFTT